MLSWRTRWRRRISAIKSMSSTPDSPAKMPDDRTTQGGHYWTLFTPGVWKLLHAVLQAPRLIADACHSELSARAVSASIASEPNLYRHTCCGAVERCARQAGKVSLTEAKPLRDRAAFRRWLSALDYPVPTTAAAAHAAPRQPDTPYSVSRRRSPSVPTPRRSYRIADKRSGNTEPRYGQLCSLEVSRAVEGAYVANPRAEKRVRGQTHAPAPAAPTS